MLLESGSPGQQEKPNGCVELREPRDVRELRELREVREIKELREVREVREVRQVRQVRELREPGFPAELSRIRPYFEANSRAGTIIGYAVSYRVL